MAALAAIVLVKTWRAYLDRGWKALLLPAAFLVTAAWQLTIQWDALGLKFEDGLFQWPQLQMPLIGGAFLGASILMLLLLSQTWKRLNQTLASAGLFIGLAALLVLPLAWALSSVLIKGTPVLPSADLFRLSSETVSPAIRDRIRTGQNAMTKKLVDFLRTNRQDEQYLLVTSTYGLAAQIMIQYGEPVMARGGIHGLDQILDPERLTHLVEKKEIRFVMLGDLSMIDRLMGAEQAGSAVDQWVRAHGRMVEPDLWRYGQSVVGPLARNMDGMSLYDLRPELGLN